MSYVRGTLLLLRAYFFKRGKNPSNWARAIDSAIDRSIARSAVIGKVIEFPLRGRLNSYRTATLSSKYRELSDFKIFLHCWKIHRPHDSISIRSRIDDDFIIARRHMCMAITVLWSISKSASKYMKLMYLKLLRTTKGVRSMPPSKMAYRNLAIFFQELNE